MDSIRTLLLARTFTVVLDPDRVASAATRPSRDADLDRFEDELAQLGFVMSLDLAMTIRRLPHEAIVELRAWISATLASALNGKRPHVPLVRDMMPPPTGDPPSTYLRRVLAWLATRAVQPCPWCGQIRPVGALDPCGHLVCRSCWDGGSFGGCPICHRRIAVGEPFVRPPAVNDLVTEHDGGLRLLHLGFDLIGAARLRFEHLVSATQPLAADDRAELEVVIDAMGPKVVRWLPIRIPVRETMAIVIARLWTVAADRAAMVRATRAHLASATDVLRIAVVLLGGNPELVEPMRLGSMGRGMRRAVLDAIDHLAPDHAIEDMWRHRGLWKRIGERLHPYEFAERLPVATLAFAALRGTRLDTATFGPAMRSEARGVTTVRVADNRLKVTPWAGGVEDRLRAGDARGAADRLGQRPAELLRRVDHLVRVAQARQPDALATVLGAAEIAATRGAPTTLLGLASHFTQRAAPWPSRVFMIPGMPPRVWRTPDRRAVLRADAIGALVATMRGELVSRASARRPFARAVIDRGLVAQRVLSGPPDALGGSHALREVTVAIEPAEAMRSAAVRPTLWDLAAIHAVARANIVYVRDHTGPRVTIASFRRRDKEQALARLARLHAGDDPDDVLDELPPANAPTWFALHRDDIPLPAGSAGCVLTPEPAEVSDENDGVDRWSAADLLRELAR